MKKINVAIIGYGNLGKFAVDAVLASPDMNLKGVVRRSTEKEESGLHEIKVVDSIEKLGEVDVAILCTPSRLVKQKAEEYLTKGINTIDSYDMHSSIYELRQDLDIKAKEHESVSIISAGWDPGSDSILRALFEACAPKGITYTNFGPGMSMGHTVVVKGVKGVKKALAMTIPLGAGIHRRIVYVEILDGFSFEEIKKTIKEDDYFSHDETHVIKVDDVDSLADKGHGVNLIRKGVSGDTNNQLFEFNMKVNNPALTSQIMVSCARASMKQKPGAYTMIEIPIIDLLAGERQQIIRRLV